MDLGGVHARRLVGFSLSPLIPLRRLPPLSRSARTVPSRSHRGDMRNGAVASARARAGLFIALARSSKRERTDPGVLANPVRRSTYSQTPSSVHDVICHTRSDRLGGLGSLPPHFGDWRRQVDGRSIRCTLYYCT